MREFFSMECTVCKSRNYRTSREMRGSKKLNLKKHCRQCGKHTPHVEKRK